jgi:hypothetical protein
MKRNERSAVDENWSRSKNDGGIIYRHIDHLRVGWDDLDDGVSHINDLIFVRSLHDGIGDYHILLRRRLQSARGLRSGTQSLNGVHQVHGLLREGFP